MTAGITTIASATDTATWVLLLHMGKYDRSWHVRMQKFDNAFVES